MCRSTALLTFVLLALAACSDDPTTVPTDVGDTSDVSDDAADVGVDTDGSGDTTVDTTVDTEPTAVCGDGVVDEGEECDAPEDDRCSDTCTVATEGDGLCVACADDLDCGGATDRCVPVGGELTCGRDCEDESCPIGYECGPLVRSGIRFESQCKPIVGECIACDDSDDDGVCDDDDACPGFDDNVDGDEDGTPDGCDECPLDPEDDSDGDGACDSDDICPGGSDVADVDDDGIPNACDECPFQNPNDEDEDGVCDNVDRCLGFDDSIDVDMDGIPDDCDESVEICDDDEDNDGDDAIDCADPDCARHTACGPCDAPVEVGTGTFTGVTEEGADELSSADSDCMFWEGGAEEAFAFIPESDGLYCATTAGSEYDTILYARTTCDDPDSEFACDDDGGDLVTSQIEFTATADVPVFLVVDGYDELEFGNYSLSISAGDCASAAANAICLDAVEAGFGTFEAELGVTSYADSSGCRGTGGAEQVYTFTAESAGTICVTSRGTDEDSPVDTVLYVRSTCNQRTTEIDCNDNIDIDDFASQLELSVTADTTYYVFVDEYADPGWAVGGPVDVTIADGACP